MKHRITIEKIREELGKNLFLFDLGQSSTPLSVSEEEIQFLSFFDYSLLKKLMEKYQLKKLVEKYPDNYFSPQIFL